MALQSSIRPVSPAASLDILSGVRAMVFCRANPDNDTAVKNQMAVSAYFTSKQILYFAFADNTDDN